MSVVIALKVNVHIKMTASQLTIKFFRSIWCGDYRGVGVMCVVRGVL